MAASVYDVILDTSVQIYKVSGESADSDNQVQIIAGVLLRFFRVSGSMEELPWNICPPRERKDFKKLPISFSLIQFSSKSHIELPPPVNRCMGILQLERIAAVTPCVMEPLAGVVPWEAGVWA